MKEVFDGHEITLDERHTFRVTGPLFAETKGGQSFESFRDAKDAIERRRLAQVKQSKAEASLAIHALDDRGRAALIRGIHSGTGDLLGVKGDVYPPVTWLREALKRQAELRDELAVLEQRVRPFRVSGRRTYGRVKVEVYEQFISDFQSEFAAKLQKATDAPVPSEAKAICLP